MTAKFITELSCLRVNGAEEKEEILEGHSPDTTNTFRKQMGGEQSLIFLLTNHE